MSRPFDIVEVEQGSPEWLEARAGLVTGSCASAVLMGPNTAGRNDYVLQLAIERIKGQPIAEEFSNRHMERGKEMEPLARVALEDLLGVPVRETGFLRHKELPIGASLDGHIGDFDTIVEIKCPKSTTHLGYLQTNRVPREYQAQVMHNLYVSGASRCIFCSYDDRMPEGLELMALEVKALDCGLADYELALKTFLHEVDEKTKSLINFIETYKRTKNGKRE